MAVNQMPNDDEMDRPPEPVTQRGGGRGYVPPAPQNGASKMYVTLSTVLAILLSVGLVYVLFIGNTVSTTKFNAQMGTIATNLATMQKSLDTAATAQTNQINNISDRVSSLSSSLSSYAGKNDLKGLVTTSDLAAYAKTSDLGTYVKASELAALKTRVETSEATIATLKTQILALQTAVNTTPPSTTNITTGLVTATVLGNTFTGQTYLAFTAGSANQTQGLSFILSNNTGKAISNVQLAIGLEILDGSGNIISSGLPVTGTGTLTLSSPGIIWQSQNTGYSYLLGFTNTVPSGVFGGIGAINQGVGQSTYNVSVSLALLAPNGVSSSNTVFNVFPIVKVVSYS